ncbi:LbetaH domain-containing protein [Falsibacillus albus]|uniref:PglD N-terminal domain-containing protein n=1 Tax=Falsibacillus albus TaxID=2478915 RepID=A0A3L7K3D0_9BACI|nr:hypothetical protein [Falsibacillus albus]RLQ96779.1 hypothetical protein D9X91_06680 [Falsibacillus albus]
MVVDKSLLIYGSYGLSEVVRQLAVDTGWKIGGVVTELERDFDLIELIHNEYPPDLYEVAIALGYSSLNDRKQVMAQLHSSGYDMATLIHPKAYVCQTATIQTGAIIMNSAVVDMHASIGEGVVIWPGVVINHNAKIEEGTFLSPNSTICGYCTVGRDSFIGAGAVVVDHRIVPPESLVKAGSVFS